MGEPLSGEAAGAGEELALRALEGHVPSLARVIRWIEDDDPRGAEAARLLYPRAGHAHVIGITGPPGAGKSTLVSGMVAEWRARDLRVAVLAVDPSSPFSGGAILGDRVRMQRHNTDPHVYIRSMATRGQLGGLARAVDDTVTVLDATGFEVVVVETVGVGQDELDIADVADTTVVVCIPGTGDEVQALKAGVLEIADCFALNKADLPGAEETERFLIEMLHLDAAASWTRRLLRTIADREQGITALVDLLAAHRAHLEGSGELADRRGARARHAVLARVRHFAQRGVLDAIEHDEHAKRLIERVRDRRLDPETAARELWKALDRA